MLLVMILLPQQQYKEQPTALIRRMQCIQWLQRCACTQGCAGCSWAYGFLRLSCGLLDAKGIAVVQRDVIRTRLEGRVSLLQSSLEDRQPVEGSPRGQL